MRTTISVRLSLGLYTGIIACLFNLIGGEITNLQHGFLGDHGYQLFDLTILLSCLILGFLLITLLFKKANSEVKSRTRTGTAIKGILILLITIPFLFSLFLVFYYIYLRLGVPGANVGLLLNAPEQGISLASFISGFLIGSIFLSRLIIVDTYGPKQAIFGSLLAGIFTVILYNFVSVIEDRLSIFQMEDIVAFPGLYFGLIFDYFLFIFVGFLYSALNYSLFILLPLWGLFGWLAHRWFYQRQHHFWPRDLAVFE